MTGDRTVSSMLLLLGVMAVWNGAADARDFPYLATAGRIYAGTALGAGALLAALATYTLFERRRSAPPRIAQTVLTAVLGLNQAYGLAAGATACSEPG
jgi:hypothetical protein